MKALEDSIDTYIQRIHEFIIRQSDYSDLEQNRSISSQLMSASDAISDTELVIEAFIAKDSSNIKIGETYLAIYGLLQALFVQQDAAIHLSRALDREDDIANYPRLKEIREIRNDSTGHPTLRGQETKKNKALSSYHQILYHTVTKVEFEETIASLPGFGMASEGHLS